MCILPSEAGRRLQFSYPWPLAGSSNLLVVTKSRDAIKAEAERSAAEAKEKLLNSEQSLRLVEQNLVIAERDHKNAVNNNIARAKKAKESLDAAVAEAERYRVTAARLTTELQAVESRPDRRHPKVPSRSTAPTPDTEGGPHPATHTTPTASRVALSTRQRWQGRRSDRRRSVSLTGHGCAFKKVTWVFQPPIDRGPSNDGRHGDPSNSCASEAMAALPSPPHQATILVVL
jgi:hypothetical protein